MNQEIREQTRSMLADIDEILGDSHKTSSRVHFDNLFPLHEGDEEVGEKYLMGDYDPTRDHTGQSQITCPYPASHAVGETIEYCDVCYQQIHREGPLKKWVRQETGEWGFTTLVEGDYISYILRGKQIEHLPFQPYLLSDYDMQEFDDTCTEFRWEYENEDEKPPTLLEWLARDHLRQNDVDALEYSLEFFGYNFFRFETDYGLEARTLEDV